MAARVADMDTAGGKCRFSTTELGGFAQRTTGRKDPPTEMRECGLRHRYANHFRIKAKSIDNYFRKRLVDYRLLVVGVGECMKVDALFLRKAEGIVEDLVAAKRLASVSVDPTIEGLRSRVVDWGDGAPQSNPTRVAVEIEIQGVVFSDHRDVGPTTCGRAAPILLSGVGSMSQTSVPSSAVAPLADRYNFAGSGDLTPVLVPVEPKLLPVRFSQMLPVRCSLPRRLHHTPPLHEFWI